MDWKSGSSSNEPHVLDNLEGEFLGSHNLFKWMNLTKKGQMCEL